MTNKDDRTMNTAVFFLPQTLTGWRLLAGRSIFLAVLLSLLVLAGCASTKRLFSFMESTPQAAESAESLAQQGLDKFKHGNYSSALEIFEKLKSTYPFSNYSLLAELKAADAQYYMDNYDEALMLYEEFEDRHPTNEAIPFVLFQMAMCSYQTIDTIDRDTSGATSAVQGFGRLLSTFPDSPYTEEARARTMAATNFLANHEYYVATFYVRTESYQEAEARLEYILSQYPLTTVAPKANDLLAALKSGNPPKRPWMSWLPDLSLPDWQLFSKK